MQYIHNILWHYISLSTINQLLTSQNPPNPGKIPANHSSPG